MSLKNANSEIQFLTGGGAIGKLIREKDWTNSSLGTPNTWPQSLRTTLNILLNSKFPMFMFWGPELICFFNDAYQPSLGNNAKHPKIIGGRGEDFWKEVWTEIKPIIDKVLDKGESSWYEDMLLPIFRNGKMENVYWTFSYSPVIDEHGEIAGVFVTCFESTEKVNALKKLTNSEDRFRTLAENIPNLAWMADAEGWIYWYNQKWYEYTGTTPEEMEGMGWQSVHDPKILPFVIDKWKKSIDSGKDFEMIFPLKGANGEFKHFLTRVLPLKNSEGEIIQWYGSNTDISEQKEIEKSIKESENRFRNYVKQAPVGIVILRGKDYVVEMANDSYMQLVQRDLDGFIGSPLFDSIPEAKESTLHLMDRVMETGDPYRGNEVAIPLKRKEKIDIYNFDFLYHPLKEEDGTISGIIVTVTEVTDKVESRKKIERNEERLNIVIEASELGTWEWHLKTNETIYSQRYLEIIGGYTESVKLTQNQLKKHIHPDDVKIRDKALKDSFKNGYLHYEARIIWNDQSIHWMEGKGKVFYDEKNQPVKLIGTIRDITKEREFQLLLMKNEQKFRLLSDSMPQHIWTSDTDGNLNYFNQSVFDYSGFSLKQINEKGWLDIVHPDDREENVSKWVRSITTGDDFLFEHRFRRYDGEYRWQLSRAIPQRDADGNIQMWVGSSTDIQAHKEFAEELEKQVNERTKQLLLLNETLQQSEERYQLMVEEVQDYSILYVNKQGTVENWNKGAEKIKGYKAHEIIGENFSVFYTDDDRESNLPQYFLNQATLNGRYRQEGWRVRKDRSLFWASVTITAVRNNDNEIIGFSKVTHDLTAKKEAEDKIKLNAAILEQKNQELEKMNKELQSFAYISSHDLQEPLRKIQTFSSQIVERELGNLSENGKDKFRRIQNAALRMQNLINDLLAYSRTNTQERQLIKVDFNQIIEDVKEDLREELQQKNATVEAEKLQCEVEIIPFQFHQLLFNLISNSLKFSRKDVAPVITMKCAIKKGKDLKIKKLYPYIEYCHITFSDNGIGFEPQYSEKIFEVFQRLHEKEIYQGTGIGLAIVKKIIDNHHGLITANGEVGKGATFDMYFPVKKYNDPINLDFSSNKPTVKEI